MDELTQAEKRSYRQWCVTMTIEHGFSDEAVISDAEELYQYIINGTIPDKVGE